MNFFVAYSKEKWKKKREDEIGHAASRETQRLGVPERWRSVVHGHRKKNARAAKITQEGGGVNATRKGGQGRKNAVSGDT